MAPLEEAFCLRKHQRHAVSTIVDHGIAIQEDEALGSDGRQQQQRIHVPAADLEMTLGSESKGYLQIASGLLIAIASYAWWKRLTQRRGNKDPPSGTGCPCGYTAPKRSD